MAFFKKHRYYFMVIAVMLVLTSLGLTCYMADSDTRLQRESEDYFYVFGGFGVADGFESQKNIAVADYRHSIAQDFVSFIEGNKDFQSGNDGQLAWKTNSRKRLMRSVRVQVEIDHRINRLRIFDIVLAVLASLEDNIDILQTKFLSFLSQANLMRAIRNSALLLFIDTSLI